MWLSFRLSGGIFQNVKLAKNCREGERNKQTGEKKRGLHWWWGWSNSRMSWCAVSKSSAREREPSKVHFQRQTQQFSSSQPFLTFSRVPAPQHPLQNFENLFPLLQASEDPARSPKVGSCICLLRPRGPFLWPLVPCSVPSPWPSYSSLFYPVCPDTAWGALLAELCPWSWALEPASLSLQCHSMPPFPHLSKGANDNVNSIELPGNAGKAQHGVQKMLHHYGFMRHKKNISIWL